MLRPRFVSYLLILALGAPLLTGCGAESTPVPSPSPASTDSPLPPTSTPAPSFPAATEPDRYRRSPAPLVARAESDKTAFLQDGIGFQTGPYRLEYTGCFRST